MLLTLLLLAAINLHAMNISFKPWGIMVDSLDRSIKKVELFKGEKLLLSYPTYSRRRVLFFLKWRSSEEFIIKAGGKSFKVKAPRRPGALVKVYAPLGQSPYEIPVYGGNITKDITVTGPEGAYKIGISVEGMGKEVAFRFMGRVYRVKGEFGKVFINVQENLKKSSAVGEKLLFEKPFKCKVALEIRLRNIPIDELVEVRSWRIPTDPTGYLEPYRLKDTLVLKSPILGVLKPLGVKVKERDPHEPFCFQALTIKNKTGYPASILVRSEFLDPDTKMPVPWFYPKGHGSTGVKEVLGFVKLPGKGERDVVLPVYLDPKAQEGEYIDRVHISLMGGGRSIVLEKAVRVKRVKSTETLLVLIFLLSGILFFAVFSKIYRKTLKSLGVNSLMLIASIGAAGFCVKFTGFLLFNLLYAILGPFNLLVGGLVTEVLYYITLSILVVLLPRVGAVSLSGIVSYVMSSVVMGGLSVLGIIFLGFSLATRETLLYLLGVTRGKATRSRLVLSLSLSDTLEKSASLLLHTVFFRLFYPTWYIVTVAFVTGFLYTALGSYIGFPLGEKLKRVSI